MAIQENNMNREMERKLEACRLDKGVELKDGPIEGTCMVYGDWSTTVFEFLDTLVCHPKTHKKMPKWHEDFMVIPTINALYDEIKHTWPSKA